MQRDAKMNLATYCILFGGAGVLVSVFAMPKLRQLIKLRNQCHDNQIYDVQDIDELLEKAKKDKQNNKDGLLKLQLPILMQGILCTSGWKKEDTFNALDEKIPKDTYISKLKVTRDIALNIELFQSVEYSSRGEMYLKDFENNTKKSLVIKDDIYLSNLFKRKEFYYDRTHRNVVSLLARPIQLIFDIFQVFGLRSIKVGLDEKLFTFSSNIPVYFFAKIFYHRESGQFFIVPQNKLCTSIKNLALQLQKEVVKMVGGIQVTLGISMIFLSVGIFLIRDRIREKLIEIYQKKENQKLDKISQKFSDENKCIVCFCNARNLLFFPCKHIALCSICYLGLKKNRYQNCPVCKTKIRKCLKIEYDISQLIVNILYQKFTTFYLVQTFKISNIK